MEDPPPFLASNVHHLNGPSSSSSSFFPLNTSDINTIHPYLPAHPPHPVDTTDRLALATYLASRVPTLQRIGFEYRRRTAVVRYEDRWVDWEIERRPVDARVHAGHVDSVGTGGGGTPHEGDLVSDVTLWELQETWYVFPEVWKQEELVQETYR